MFHRLWEFGITAGNSCSVVAIENTGSDVVGMENEESDGDGPVKRSVLDTVKSLYAFRAITSNYSHRDLSPGSDTTCRSQPR
ncbi:hypothetical protein Tco_1283687 [Tanacetum coccineum]